MGVFCFNNDTFSDYYVSVYVNSSGWGSFSHTGNNTGACWWMLNYNMNYWT
jgi:hypothetical protein